MERRIQYLEGIPNHNWFIVSKLPHPYLIAKALGLRCFGGLIQDGARPGKHNSIQC
jgi:hypothetical protein